MINEIAKKLNLNSDDIITYGSDMAKIVKGVNSEKKGNLILVTSITPTPYGEGKTTLVIGINDVLRKLGKNSVAVIREPSMGPTFGLKGGATGGGRASVIPENDINLAFTGDFNAITNANNLICALIDNHIFQGNELNIKKIVFNRAIDICDRSLRNININDKTYHFDITAASEIMGIMTLAKDESDLKRRIDNILIGYNENNLPIYFKELKATGAIYTLLKNALYPNLVRSLENNPVIVHMGPFANVSIGCNSLISTNLAMNLADYTIVEAGFGSDLGCEKFFDIKCRVGNLNPNLVILNVTIRALTYHGNNNLVNGLNNLEKHIQNISCFTNNILVVLNKFEDDKIEDIDILKDFVNKLNIPFEICESYVKGSEGSIHLGLKIIDLVKDCNINYLYDLNEDIQDKINKVCTKMYHVNNVIYSEEVLEKINNLKKIGFNNLPICIAKSPLTLNGNKDSSLDYIKITDIKVNNGAGYIVVYSGNILTLPGLPKHPKACDF